MVTVPKHALWLIVNVPKYIMEVYEHLQLTIGLQSATRIATIALHGLAIAHGV